MLLCMLFFSHELKNKLHFLFFAELNLKMCIILLLKGGGAVDDERIFQVFEQKQGYAETQDLLQLGIDHYDLKKLENSGKIERIRRGLYRLNMASNVEHDELTLVSTMVPEGILCLLSSLAYHQLTTFVPWEHQVAILRSRKRMTSIPYPPIKFVYFAEKQLNLGIQTVQMGAQQVRVYDMEKSICDIVRYKNKIGIDIMKESLINYLKRNNRDIVKLLDYAKQLHVRDIETYLEVLM
jgi:predicted transcriptional regulator of viral defense system